MMKKLLVTAISVALLSGCASNTPMIDKGLESSANSAIEVQKHVRNNGMLLNSTYAPVIDSGIWVSTETIKSNSMMPSTITRDLYTFIKQDSLSLQQLTQFLSLRTGINFTIAKELREDPSSQNQNSGNSQSPIPTVFAGNFSQLGLGNTSSMQTATAKNDLDNVVTIGRYTPNMKNVTLEQFLDHMASSMGISWRYSATEGIHFYYYDSETFYIHATSSTISGSGSASSSSESSEGSDSGSSEQEMDIEIEVEFWDDLGESLEQLIKDKGEINVNQSTGAVTVFGNRSSISSVADYIKNLNKLLKLQVHMQLMIVTMQVDASDVASLSYDLLYNGDKFGLTLGTTGSTAAGASNIVGSILDPDSKFKDSKFLIDALSSRGVVTNTTTTDMLISNYRPYHFKNGGTINYVGKVTSTTTPNVGTEQSVEVEELSTGMGVVFLPNIHDKEQLSIDLMFGMSDLVKLEPVIVSEETIYLPQTSNYDVTNTFNMRSGESRVLAAFEDKSQSSLKSGTLSPDNFLLGGGRSTSGKRELVILIGTPRIM